MYITRISRLLLKLLIFNTKTCRILTRQIKSHPTLHIKHIYDPENLNISVNKQIYKGKSFDIVVITFNLVFVHKSNYKLVANTNINHLALNPSCLSMCLLTTHYQLLVNTVLMTSTIGSSDFYSSGISHCAFFQ